MKKTIFALLAISVMLSGCGQRDNVKSPGDSASGPAINEASESTGFRATLDSLLAREDTLGLDGTYRTIDEITDGTVDSRLLGRWVSGSYEYTFSEDGIMTSMLNTGDAVRIPFTCLEIE